MSASARAKSNRAALSTQETHEQTVARAIQTITDDPADRFVRVMFGADGRPRSLLGRADDVMTCVEMFEVIGERFYDHAAEGTSPDSFIVIGLGRPGEPRHDTTHDGAVGVGVPVDDAVSC